MPSPSSPTPSFRARWAWAAGLVVTVALLYWTLHDLDPAVVFAHIRRADPILFVASVAVATCTFPIRTFRWRVILRDAEGHGLPWLPLWHATAVGFMANNLLPVRAGEFARAYVAKRQLPVPFLTALASIGVERAIDGLVMVALMAVALASPAFPRDAAIGGVELARAATWAAALFGVILAGALVVVLRPVPWLTLWSGVTHRLFAATTADRLTHMATALVAGFAVLKSPGRFAVVIGWSLVLWLVNAASFAICFGAFGMSVPAKAALLLQGLIGFGVALPSSPGFFGPFEAATRVTLALYGISAERAVSYAVAYHIAGFLPITLLGLYSLSRVHVRLGELRAAGPLES